MPSHCCKNVPSPGRSSQSSARFWGHRGQQGPDTPPGGGGPSSGQAASDPRTCWRGRASRAQSGDCLPARHQCPREQSSQSDRWIVRPAGFCNVGKRTQTLAQGETRRTLHIWYWGPKRLDVLSNENSMLKSTSTFRNKGLSFQLSGRSSEETSVISSLQRVKWNFVKLRQMRPKIYNFWYFLKGTKVYQCWQLTATSSCQGRWYLDRSGSDSSQER